MILFDSFKANTKKEPQVTPEYRLHMQLFNSSPPIKFLFAAISGDF